MIFKYYKPVAPGIRFKRRLTFKRIKHIKQLRKIRKLKGGRNISGQQTSYARNSGVNRSTYVVDNYNFYSFKLYRAESCYSAHNRAGLICARSVDGLAAYKNNNKFYYSQQLPLFLRDIRRGSEISNLELRLGGGSQLIRAAGSFGKVLGIGFQHFRWVKLPSLVNKSINRDVRATLGENSSSYNFRKNYSKAGTKRRLGYNSVVRGLAMNAVDHPHGGKSGPSRSSVSPWGRAAK